MSLKLNFRQIRRSPYQTLSAILIMVITFFMVTIFVLIGFLSSAILQHFETKPQISAFYPNDTPESEILDIKKQLEQSGLTKEVKYISSKDAVEKFKQETEDEIDSSLDILSDKVLPPSLEITAWNLDNLRTLKKVVEQKEGVNVVYVEEIVNRLDSWLTGVRNGGLVLLVLLVIESILVIWTIIAMRISQRKHEIEIMRLLGATSWYIRAPFIVEGMTYGIIGSIIGTSITLAILETVAPGIKAFLTGIPILPLTPQGFFAVVSNNVAQASVDGVPMFPISPLFVVMLLSAEMMVGMIIGALGSYIAVLRNLQRS
jgi:cell division transport system permease protein